MEGERILKSLLNGEIDGLYEDTKVGLSKALALLFCGNKLFSFTKIAVCEVDFFDDFQGFRMINDDLVGGAKSFTKF